MPPELRYVTFRSVDTPVEKRPRDASASEPPKSTIEAMVPPWRMPKRFVCSFWIESSKWTLPGEAAVTRNWNLSLDYTGQKIADALSSEELAIVFGIHVLVTVTYPIK